MLAKTSLQVHRLFVNNAGVIPLGRCVFCGRFVALALMLSAATLVLGADVQLNGSWLTENQQWVVRIQPAHSEIQIKPGRNVFVEVIDTATRQRVPFRLKSVSRRFVDLAFPQLRRPMNLSLVVRGLLLVDQTGRRVAYNEELTVRAPPAAAGESTPPRPTSTPHAYYYSTGASPSPEQPRLAPGGGQPPHEAKPQPTIVERVSSGEPIGGGAAPPDIVGQGAPRPEPIMTGAEGPEETQIPQFPFPPPLASAFEEIPRELLVAYKAQPKLKDVDVALSSAFARCGYGEKSFYAVPDGFAMASRLEQINADGSFGTNRWAAETAPIRTFSIESYLGALFRARAGHFRVVIFMVTNHPFNQTDAKITSDQAKSWVKKGSNKLPKKIGDRDYTDDYTCMALIYEFETLGGGQARFVEPSEITGRTHLEKSGLLPALAHAR